MIFVSTTRVKWIIYQTISYILILKASLSPLNDPQINVFGTVATFTIAMCDSKFCVALACKFDYIPTTVTFLVLQITVGQRTISRQISQCLTTIVFVRTEPKKPSLCIFGLLFS